METGVDAAEVIGLEAADRFENGGGNQMNTVGDACEVFEGVENRGGRYGSADLL